MEGKAELQGITSIEAQENNEYITGFKLFAVTSGVSIVGLILLLDMSIISTAIPEITSHFRSLPDVGWYTSAYQLANAALQPLSGKLYTHFKAKSTFLAFFAVFQIGNLVCGLANSSVMLIAGRTIAGCGASGLMNGSMTIIAGSTSMEKRPSHTGMMMGISQLGLIMGPLVGGVLTERVSWRWCFYINLPMGAAAAVALIFIRIPDITKKPSFSLSLVRTILPELDLIGSLLLAPASLMLLLALQFGAENKYKWDSATIIGLLCGSAVLGAIFMLWERRMGSRAMIPFSLVRNRILWTSSLMMMFFFMSVFGVSVWLPMYFQAIKGASPTMSGVFMLPSILSQLVAAVISGIGVSRIGYYLPFSISSTALMTVGNGLMSTFTQTTSVGKWVGYQILLGTGRGAGMQMAIIAVQYALPPSQVPLSLAFLIFAQNIGGAVSSVVATTIFSQTLTSKIHLYAPSVSSEAALAAGGGADAVRALVPRGSEELAGVFRAYTMSLRNVLFLLLAFAAMSFIFSWGMGWKDIRKKKDVTSDNDEKQATEGV
ncbi:efflux pump protein [Corynespora cassiicola Philippines]|uniref:Efflux pump protein n=1 Tax=Corynespora cassiicola Philippines TaxID=1448308 RepID=A0A2T2N936_CORCC|nr:efflux pump protein [Corynespora cassiicola Philippines]